MKSKKLFAILTIVSFLMTLIPAAAFGAALPFSRTNSTLTATNLSVDDVYDDHDADAVTATAAKFTLTFKDAADELVTNHAVTFYLRTGNDLAVGFVDDNDNGINDEAAGLQLDNQMDSSDGQAITTATTNDQGKVVFYVGANVGTSFTVEAMDGADGNLIGSKKTVSVEKAAGAFDVRLYEDDDDAASQLSTDGDGHLQATAGTGFEVRVDIGKAEEDVEVTFKQKLNNGSWTTLGTDTTDSDGVATLWVEPSASGTYFFKGVAGDDSGTSAQVDVAASEPDQLEMKTSAGKIAVDNDKTVEVYVRDSAGNLVKNSPEKVVEWSFISAPAESEWDGRSDYASSDAKGVAGFTFKPDELGTYTVKFKLETDAAGDAANYDVGNDSVTVSLEAVKLGTVTELSFKLVNDDKDEIPAIRYAEDTNDPAGTIPSGRLAVTYKNADGTSLSAGDDPSAKVTFASSDPADVSVAQDGKLTVEDDEFTGTVTITASYEDDQVIGTYDVKVAGAPNAITLTPTMNGKVATVAVQLVDKDGNPTISNSARGLDKDAIRVTAPAGVTVSGISNVTFDGKGAFTLTADQYGKYSATAIVTVDDNQKSDGTATELFGTDVSTADKNLSKTASFEFVQPASEIPVIGAKNVTMFIGAPGYTQDGVAKVSDVAPFIQDGRTFVAVRPVAEAFGATAAYDEATKTVTLTRSDMTVTIVIGSNAITVVKGGVTSTVTADVAAFIKDGRTVLPFRAVGDAFGAKVNYDAATQAVTYAQ